MKRPCTKEEQATLVHMLGHMHGDGWNKVLITGVEAYVVLDDEYRTVTHVVRTWPSCVPPVFTQESKPITYQGDGI